jgi:hypothetical protein
MWRPADVQPGIRLPCTSAQPEVFSVPAYLIAADPDAGQVSCSAYLCELHGVTADADCTGRAPQATHSEPPIGAVGQQAPAGLQRDDRNCQHLARQRPRGRAAPATSTATAAAASPSWSMTPGLSHPRPGAGISQLPMTMPTRSARTSSPAAATASAQASHIGPGPMCPAGPARGIVLHGLILRGPRRPDWRPGAAPEGTFR